MLQHIQVLWYNQRVGDDSVQECSQDMSPSESTEKQHMACAEDLFSTATAQRPKECRAHRDDGSLRRHVSTQSYIQDNLEGNVTWTGIHI